MPDEECDDDVANFAFDEVEPPGVRTLQFSRHAGNNNLIVAGNPALFEDGGTGADSSGPMIRVLNTSRTTSVDVDRVIQLLKNEEPKIDYLTLIDGFIITTFLILAAGVVLTVVMGRLEQRGQQEIGRRVDRICRWAFPAAYAAVSFLVYLGFFILE